MRRGSSGSSRRHRAPAATPRPARASSCSRAPLPRRRGPREQAKRMHDRLVGVPPTRRGARPRWRHRSRPATRSPRPTRRCRTRTSTRSALKNFVTPWTNVDRTRVRATLNDYTATVIGMIRDDVPFNTVLTADLVYVGAPGVVVGGLLADRQRPLPAARGRRASISAIRPSSCPCCSRRCRARMLDAGDDRGRHHDARRRRGVLQRAARIGACGASRRSTSCAATWSS